LPPPPPPPQPRLPPPLPPPPPPQPVMRYRLALTSAQLRKLTEEDEAQHAAKRAHTASHAT
jgi:hypothetical protein